MVRRVTLALAIKAKITDQLVCYTLPALRETVITEKRFIAIQTVKMELLKQFRSKRGSFSMKLICNLCHVATLPLRDVRRAA